MLSDRPYMRGDYQRETTSVVTWLLCAIAGAFVLQFVAGTGWAGATTTFLDEFAFSIDGLAHGRVWSPFTYWLLHSTGNLFHVGLVLAGLFLLGRELVAPLGARGFVAVFGAGILAGAALWGLHMALTQGLLAKLVANTALTELRGTAFGLFNLFSGLALLLASVLAGGLWNAFGAAATFIAGASFAALASLGLLTYSPHAPNS